MGNSGAFGASSSSLRVPRFVERSTTVAAILGVFGFAALAVGIGVGEVVGTVIASFGTILITVGLLSVLYDAYLKDVLLEEVFDAMSIEQNIHSIDLKEVVRKDAADLSKLLMGAAEVRVLPLDPVSWAHQEWHRVLENAVGSAVQVEIFLPNHDSPHVDVLAQRFGLEKEELAHQIGRLPAELSKSWDQKKANRAGSSLAIYLYGSVPAIGILWTSHGTMLEIPPALGYGPADRTALAMLLGSGARSPLVADFIAEQFDEHRIPSFSESVKRSADESEAPLEPLERDDLKPD